MNIFERVTRICDIQGFNLPLLLEEAGIDYESFKKQEMPTLLQGAKLARLLGTNTIYLMTGDIEQSLKAEEQAEKIIEAYKSSRKDSSPPF